MKFPNTRYKFSGCITFLLNIIACSQSFTQQISIFLHHPHPLPQAACSRCVPKISPPLELTFCPPGHRPCFHTPVVAVTLW